MAALKRFVIRVGACRALEIDDDACRRMGEWVQSMKWEDDVDGVLMFHQRREDF